MSASLHALVSNYTHALDSAKALWEDATDEINVKDAEIANLQADLLKNHEITKLQAADLLKKNIEIAMLQTDLKKKDADLNANDAEIQNLKTDLQKLQANLQKL